MSNVANSPAQARIEQLLDANSFVELGGLVTARSTDFNLGAEQTPSDGVVIGHGLIDGELVFIFSQDPSVLGGSIGEMHAKKILNIYDMALKMGSPIIGLLDSTGVRLQESVDALEAMASIYAKAVSASGVIPQIIAVHGTCGGGLTTLASIADFTFMTEDAKIFVNAPDTIPGNRAEVCDTAAAAFQAEAGNVDAIGTSEEICNQIRKLLAILPSSNVENGRIEDATDDLNRAAEITEAATAAEIARELSDNHVIFEAKAAHAPEMLTALILLGGVTVGVIANTEPELTANGAEKAADFINFCDAFEIPLLSLTNVAAYATTKCSEKRLARAAAKLAYAFANATVAKINLLTGTAIGSAYTLMNSKGLGADLVFAFPTAEVAPMASKQMAQILGSEPTSTGLANAARRGYIDRLVNPADSRKYLVAAFDMLLTKGVDGPYKKHGTK